VRRPKDYNAAAGIDQSSGGGPTQSMQQQANEASNKLFIGGIPSYLEEAQVGFVALVCGGFMFVCLTSLHHPHVWFSLGFSLHLITAFSLLKGFASVYIFKTIG